MVTGIGTPVCEKVMLPPTLLVRVTYGMLVTALVWPRPSATVNVRLDGLTAPEGLNATPTALFPFCAAGETGHRVDRGRGRNAVLRAARGERRVG